LLLSNHHIATFVHDPHYHSIYIEVLVEVVVEVQNLKSASLKKLVVDEAALGEIERGSKVVW
jgi:hypothetical protein